MTAPFLGLPLSGLLAICACAQIQRRLEKETGPQLAGPFVRERQEGDAMEGDLN